LKSVSYYKRNHIFKEAQKNLTGNKSHREVLEELTNPKIKNKRKSRRRIAKEKSMIRKNIEDKMQGYF
jgi:hypothetical protein